MKRPWALPLVPLYGAGLAAKNAVYSRRMLPVRRLRQPVISAGSLSAGGAGKTPFVQALAQMLERHNVAVDVLSRGYGRRSSAVERVDARGDASRFGDEPLELARRGVEVFVGADRFAAGTVAEQEGHAALHLLDDGFQHRRLARSLDVVLLTLEDVEDHLLPAGNLREPLSSLRRADVITVRSEEADELRPWVARCTDAALWVIERRLALDAAPARPVAFCAIARPGGFVAMLRRAGVEPPTVVLRPDHYAWTEEDCRALVRSAAEAGADGFVCTAKDAVKIARPALAALERAGGLWVAELQVSLLDEAEATRTILHAAGLA